MNVARQQPIELTEEAAHLIAETAEVPADRRAEFAIALPGLFRSAREDHRWDVKSAPLREAIPPQLLKVEEAARQLRACLDDLDEAARRSLGIYAIRHELFGSVTTDRELRFQVMDLVEGGRLQEGLLLVASYSEIIEKVRIAAATREWPAGLDGGRPSKRLDLPGNPEVTPFDLFVFNIERHVLWCGGCTTMNKNDGKGSFTQILRIASPHLPLDFIPPGVLVADEGGTFRGLSRVYRVRSKASRTGQKPHQK